VTERRRRPALPALDGRRAAFALAGIVALATVLIARQGVRMSARVLYDEQLTIDGARYIGGHFPDGLWVSNAVFPRGPERLTAWILAVVDGVAPIGHEMFWDRIAVALLFALAALPAYALARGLKAGPWAALAAAALAVLNPWAAFGTTLLNTTAAYTTLVLAVWAMWRTTVRPSMRADAIAILAMALMPLARVSHAALVAGLPVAVLVTTWVDIAGVPRRPLAVARRVWDEHRLLVLAAVVGAIGLAVVGIDRFTGEYAASAGFPAAHLANQAKAAVVQLGAGLLLLLVPALGWLAWAAVRRPDRESGAFALIVVTTILVLLYVNKTGDPEERYVATLAPLLAVASVAAIARREVRPVPTLLAGALLVWLMTTRGYVHPDPGDLQLRLTLPAQLLLSGAGVERVTGVLPFSAGPIITVIALGAVAVAAALAVVRGGAYRVLATTVLAVSVVAGLAGAAYTSHKLRTTRGKNYGTASAQDLTFVDRAVRGAPVSGLSYDTGGFPQGPLGLDLLRMFNRSVVNSVGIAGRPNWFCCAGFGSPASLAYDGATGRIVMQGTMHDDVVFPVQFLPVGLAGRQIGTLGTSDPPFRLWRVRRPLHASFAVTGTDDGWIRPGRRARIRFFGAAVAPGERRCMHATVLAPPIVGGPTQWRLGPRTGTLPPANLTDVEVPLPGRGTVDLTFTAGPGGKLADDRVVGGGISDIRAGACDEV
jgi:hypothetical protein